MSIATWLAERILPHCPTDWLADKVLPRYQTDAERLARLDRLRSSVMREWEGALEMGDGNDFHRMPATMVAGLVDVARWATILMDPEHPDYTERNLRESINGYLRDIDNERWRSKRGY